MNLAAAYLATLALEAMPPEPVTIGAALFTRLPVKLSAICKAALAVFQSPPCSQAQQLQTQLSLGSMRQAGTQAHSDGHIQANTCRPAHLRRHIERVDSCLQTCVCNLPY